MSIQDLLGQLNTFWNASANPRYQGEHPECLKLQEQLKTLLSELSDDELLQTVKAMSEEQLEQLDWVLMELRDGNRAFIAPYVRF
jgi:hypothetical protein